MGLTQTIAPTETAISVSEAKAQLRETEVAENSLIDLYIQAATEHAQRVTQRQFVTATWAYTVDRWPRSSSSKSGPDDVLRLPRSPAASITQLDYIDPDGASQTLATSVYELISDIEPALVGLKNGQSWPSMRLDRNAITVTFTAGYGAASTVPAQIKQAIAIYVEHLFDRDPGPVPEAYWDLLWPFRVMEVV